MMNDELIDYLWSLQPNQLGRIAVEGNTLIKGCDQLVNNGTLYAAHLQPDIPHCLHYQWSTEGHRYAEPRNQKR